MTLLGGRDDTEKTGKHEKFDKMKTAIFTGIGRLGVPVVERLADKGWRVVVSYRPGRGSEQTVQGLTEQYPETVSGVPAEVTAPHAAAEFVRVVAERAGQIDAVINIASDYPSEADHWQRWKAGGEVTEADWAFYPSNFTLYRNVILAAVPHLKQAGGGCIINFGDARSMQYFDGNILDPYADVGGIVQVELSHVKQIGLQRLQAVAPARHINPYTLAKIDLAYLTRVLAINLGGDNIRVNTIGPGPILPPPDSDGTNQQVVADQTALGRWGGTDPIVRAVDYLLEDDYVTGEILKVDGGLNICQRFRER
jgi:NAD(P)-dependent dehydrogenase (short-subunit alcohol dehydrogenase family)